CLSSQRQNTRSYGDWSSDVCSSDLDAEHILVSKHVAEDLEEYEHWRPLLHDLGTCEVKHGMRVGIANLYADQVGNPHLQKKFEEIGRASCRERVVIVWGEASL